MKEKVGWNLASTGRMVVDWKPSAVISTEVLSGAV